MGTFFKLSFDTFKFCMIKIFFSDLRGVII
ncbi:hypothetical protein CoNPh17_CDS0241 [Staphylococcus phage S-CoN_Ph17]|nr:hypothetical protein CoNPh17_CDS0241 [Staphylococcus phage S-CoN_Ph17]